MESPVDSWVIEPGSLVDITPEKVRDLMVDCFVHAQSETVAQAKSRLGMNVDESSVEQPIQTRVRSAFKAVGGDYDLPTPSTLKAVVERLGAQSTSTGMPKSIVEHHTAQMLQVIDTLR